VPEPTVRVIHSAVVEPLQVQVGPVTETVTDPRPPVEANSAVVGAMPVTAHAAAAWVTVCVNPPSVIVPGRGVARGPRPT
jgi:hypothetical protein